MNSTRVKYFINLAKRTAYVVGAILAVYLLLKTQSGYESTLIPKLKYILHSIVNAFMDLLSFFQSSLPETPTKEAPLK